MRAYTRREENTAKIYVYMSIRLFESLAHIDLLLNANVLRAIGKI